METRNQAANRESGGAVASSAVLGGGSCLEFVEDPNICWSNGEPKGQCINCGGKEKDHACNYCAETMKWTTRPIPRQCERLNQANLDGRCGRPTAYAYPAHPDGWAALCEEHAAPHLPYARPINDLLDSGERMESNAICPACGRRYDGHLGSAPVVKHPLETEGEASKPAGAEPPNDQAH